MDHRRPNPSLDILTETLSVAITLDTKEKIKTAAESGGETAASFVRRAVADRLAGATAQRPRGRG